MDKGNVRSNCLVEYYIVCINEDVNILHLIIHGKIHSVSVRHLC